MIASYSLPMPPSVNASYAHKLVKSKKTGKQIARRYSSEALASWKKNAGKELMIQRPHKFEGEVEIELAIQRDEKRLRADVDGRVKSVLDLLVDMQVIKDDRHVLSVKATWVPNGTGHACKVTVSSAGE